VWGKTMNIRSHGAGRADGNGSPRRVSSGPPLLRLHLPGAVDEWRAEATVEER
jgi:hypothetical protein